MQDSFNFYLRGFRTKYKAIPTEQAMSIYAGEEYVTHFDHAELASMLSRGHIVLAREEAVQ